MRKYIFYNLRRFVPFYVVSFVIMGWTYLITILNTGFYQRYMVDEYGQVAPYSFLSVSTLYFLPLIFFAVVLMIIPFIAQSYRFNLASVDTYYQAPIKKNHIKYINSLCLLIPTLISFTVIFFIGVLLIFLKQRYGSIPEDTEYLHYERTSFNFGYYLLGYLAAIIILPTVFFFSSFIVSKTNRMFNAIALTAISFFALMFITGSQYYLVASILNIRDNNVLNPMFANMYAFFGISPVYPIVVLGETFESLIKNNEFINVIHYDNMLHAVHNYIQLGLFVLFSGYTVYDFFTTKEPSGEYAGKPEGHDFFQTFILHASFGVFAITGGLLVQSGGIDIISFFTLLSSLSGFVFTFVAYYLFLSLLRKNFKLRLKDLYFMLGNASLYVITFTIAMISLNMN